MSANPLTLYFAVQSLNMKARRFALILAFITIGVMAQDGPGRVARRVQADTQRAASAPIDLFQLVPSDITTDSLWRGALSKAEVLRFDPEAAMAVLRSRPRPVTFRIPSVAGDMLLDMQRADITSPGFVVRTSSGDVITEQPVSVHYRGVIRGRSGSLVAISVFEKEVMGVIGDAENDYVIGRFANDRQGLHVFYNEADLLGSPESVCATPDLPMHELDEPRGGGPKTVRCVNIYWEAAYDLFQNKGSVANVTTYLTGLFNQMATLYDNENVDVVLSEIFVWNTASPYNATSSSGRLNQFGTTRTSFNGDLAHLIDLGGYGGVAWLSALCGGTSSRMAYSGINTTFNSVPTYSWSVEVVTHETGHNLGSKHTHACAWNGDNTAIDGCGPAAGYTEGSCAQGPIPSSAVGGTIMSYCHLVSAGIKFANGFGPQPGDLIRQRVNQATCLGVCGTTCDAPTPLTVSNLNATSATLNWSNYGASTYTLRWKPVSSGTWTTITGLTGTTYALSGLTQNVQYEYQVLSVCSAASSVYSTSNQFTTPVPCPEAYEPNNTTGTAPLLTLPATVNALISSSSDVDYYRFTLSATSTINVFLGNLPADFDLRLLNSAGTQIASSANGSTTSEYISYANATAGTYYVNVYGYAGAFSAVQCYLLTISAYVACAAPQGLSSNSVVYNGANITWTAVQGAGSYDLRWKATSSGTWNDVFGLVTNSYALSGLTELTSYDVQVRTNCAGGTQGGASEYTTTHSFTTPQAPCDVVPRSVVAGKVFLEGAYRSAGGLMIDSLRVLNLLPLTEPYTAMGHTITGPTSTTAGVLAISGTNAAVDWVLVELRANSAPYAVLEARVGLVQRDGDIVAPDGTSAIGFCTNSGTYRVAVRHRNHLGVMTGSGIALSGTATALNLTASGTATYGSGARKSVSGVMTMWAGDVSANGELKYTGEGNDRDPILLYVGGSVPTNTVTLYSPGDVNMDGKVKYTGQDNDRDPILTNIGGSVPTATLQEQLP